MALQNSPYLFTGGNERINTLPHVQLYAQLKQREQARNDAFDEYVRNLNKNINPTGLRNQERPVFEDKLRQWQEFGMQNREALRNPRKDGGRASMEFQNRYQDLNNLVSESKIEEEKKKPLIEIMTDPNKRDRLNEKELFPKIQSHDQGIFKKNPETGEWERDQTRRSFNVADLNYNPKPWEEDKYFKGMEDIKPSDKTQVVRKLPNGKQEITTTAVFKPEDKDAVAVRATANYMEDKSFKGVIDKLNPDEYKDFYKQQFGEEMKTPADLAAAYTLQGMQRSNTSQEVKDDPYVQGMAKIKYTQDRIDARQRRQQDFSIARENYRNSKNAKIVDEYVKGQYDDPDAWKSIVSYNGKQYSGKYVKAPKFLVDKYSVNKGTKDAPKWNDPEFFISDDGKYVFPVYRTGEKSKSGWDKITIDSKPINMADWKIEISNDWVKSNRTANELSDQFDAEGEVNESRSSTNMQKTSKSLPAGQPRTVRQNGVTYTWDDQTGEYK